MATKKIVDANYSVTIKTVSKELSAKERIMLKDVSNANKLDALTQAESHIDINVDCYAELEIHNEKSDDKDYTNYLIVGTDGEKYVTGSPSFWTAFKGIIDEVEEAGLKADEWTLRVYRKPSKNREGKDFITCSMI